MLLCFKYHSVMVCAAAGFIIHFISEHATCSYRLLSNGFNNVCCLERLFFLHKEMSTCKKVFI